MLCWCCVWWVCSRFLSLSPGPPSAGPPFPWTAQNFAFFLSRRKFHFSFTLWGLLVELWPRFKAMTHPLCAFGRLQTCTFERSDASNTTKIPRENPQRGKKRTNFPAGGKKSAKFWPPTLRAPTPSGPHPVDPPTTRPAHHSTKNKKLVKCGLAKFGQQKLAKFGQIRLAKCGQTTLAKCGIGQIRFGQMRPNKDGQIRFGQIRLRPNPQTQEGTPRVEAAHNSGIPIADCR